MTIDEAIQHTYEIIGSKCNATIFNFNTWFTITVDDSIEFSKLQEIQTMLSKYTSLNVKSIVNCVDEFYVEVS